LHPPSDCDPRSLSDLEAGEIMPEKSSQRAGIIASPTSNASGAKVGYAVECGLKACAARQSRQDEVPEKTVVTDFYTHRLDKLLGISGVKADLELRAGVDQAFQVNWNTVRDWSETSRTITRRPR
jgi:hypothetical protein